jgi:hypothetical protein
MNRDINKIKFIAGKNVYLRPVFKKDFEERLGKKALEEFEENGFNKFSIGKFTTYKETVLLRDDLKRVGFIDCFIIAKSYGVPVNINEALQLSGEKWIRGTTN